MKIWRRRSGSWWCHSQFCSCSESVFCGSCCDNHFIMEFPVLILASFCVFSSSHTHNSPLQTIDSGGLSIWSDAHHLPLKVNSGVDFRWLSKDDKYITMEMSSFTKGYVSVGFCPKWKGTMEGCDIVLGWVDNKNGTPYLFDYYARGNTLPELDVNQDYELISGTQDAGVTTIRFRRKWNTGDDFYDADLENDDVRVMWAWHPEDPASAESYFKHAGYSRGHLMHDMSFRNPLIHGHSHNHQHGHDHHDASSAEELHPALKTYFTAMWLIVVYALAL